MRPLGWSPSKEHLTWSSKTWSLSQMCYLIWKYSWEIHMIAPCLFLHLRLRRYFSCLFRGSDEIPCTQTPIPFHLAKVPRVFIDTNFNQRRKRPPLFLPLGSHRAQGSIYYKSQGLAELLTPMDRSTVSPGFHL